jgi:hypothetical protein
LDYYPRPNRKLLNSNKSKWKLKEE